jgi:hypothetical protein
VSENNLQDVGQEEVAYAAGKTTDYGKKEVPIVIQLTEEDIVGFKELDSKDKQKYARHFLKRVDKSLAKRLKNYTCNKISCPRTDNSYKDHITRLVTMANEKKTGFKDLTVADKDNNVWQVFVDDREFRMIYQIYHGATPKPLGGWRSNTDFLTDFLQADTTAPVVGSYNPFDE